MCVIVVVVAVFLLLVARENFINITFFWHFLCVFLKGFKRAAAACSTHRKGSWASLASWAPLALLLLRKSSRTF